MSVGSPFQHSQEVFEIDLYKSFGDRSNDFTKDLKELLFEFWVRARLREQEEQALSLVASLQSNPEVRDTFLQVLKDLLNVGPSLTLTKSSLGKLDLNLATTLSNEATQLFAQGAANGLIGIPELYGDTDKTQENLRERLEKLGLLSTGTDWAPVFQNIKTGDLVSLEGSYIYTHHQVQETLSSNGSDMWFFPEPKPLFFTYPPAHILIMRNGLKEASSNIVWNDNGQHVNSITIIGSVNTDEVRASYPTTAEYFVGGLGLAGASLR